MTSYSGYDFEDEIREFLRDIGFKDIPKWRTREHDREFFWLGGQEIDAFGRLDDLFLIIEAVTSSSASAPGIQTKLQKINGYRKNVISDIKKKYLEYGYRDSIFILWTKDMKLTKSHYKLANNSKIALRDSFDLELYNQACNILKVKELVQNYFLRDLELQLKDAKIFREGQKKLFKQ